MFVICVASIALRVANLSKSSSILSEQNSIFFCKNITLITIFCSDFFQHLVLYLMDPWGNEVKNTEVVPKFEDNFKPSTQGDKLADSAEYLAVLERKLKAVRSKNKVVENLSAYREDCINRLMRDGCDLDPVIGDTEADRLIEDVAE